MSRELDVVTMTGEEYDEIQNEIERLTDLNRVLEAGFMEAARSAPDKGLMMDNQVTVLPDGSAFATASWPLPKDHWLYAPRGEWDSARDEYAECPVPILTNAQRQAVTAAARYAIRGATMCGQDEDFDPDALVLNLCYALCGPAGGALLPADTAMVDEGGDKRASDWPQGA